MSKWEIGHPPTGAVRSGSGGGGEGGPIGHPTGATVPISCGGNWNFGLQGKNAQEMTCGS